MLKLTFYSFLPCQLLHNYSQTVLLGKQIIVVFTYGNILHKPLKKNGQSLTKDRHVCVARAFAVRWIGWNSPKPFWWILITQFCCVQCSKWPPGVCTMMIWFCMFLPGSQVWVLHFGLSPPNCCSGFTVPCLKTLWILLICYAIYCYFYIFPLIFELFLTSGEKKKSQHYIGLQVFCFVLIEKNNNSQSKEIMV